MKVLTNAREVRWAIRNVLRDKNDDRIVIVAFVGADALSYLPNPEGLIVYCWPMAGGTNPHGVDRLLAAGAQVRFVDRLHAKIYWARHRGVLLGSANLSANALGEGGLRESMILLPPGAVDLHSFESSLRIICDFDGALRKLHTEHVRFLQRNPGGQGRGSKVRLASFEEWFARRERAAEWRIGWYDQDVEPPVDATRDYEQTSGAAEYANYLAVSGPRQLVGGVFTLEFQVLPARDGAIGIRGVRWWVPEVRVRTRAKGWADWPYLWFASRMLPRGALPPFECRERRFRAALAATINELGGLAWLKETSTVPSDRFLSRLAREYAGA